MLSPTGNCTQMQLSVLVGFVNTETNYLMSSHWKEKGCFALFSFTMLCEDIVHDSRRGDDGNSPLWQEEYEVPALSTVTSHPRAGFLR